MKIVCVGGGPAGLYLATSVKLRDAGHDVSVVERNSRGVTYGWGVVFWEDLLDKLYSNDPESAREIHRSSNRWENQEVHVRGRDTAYIDGYGFSIGRKRLLDILTKRAMDLGANIEFKHEAQGVSEFADADLIVACDGVNSCIRQLYCDHFQTSIGVGRNKYIWLGTPKVFDAFTFAFEETDAGWIWFHAYRFDSDFSTCIVECSPQTWEGLGFGELRVEESIALLQEIFEPYLNGHPLVNQMSHLSKAPWLNFQRISNERWRYGNIVLVGDAAHTTHFTIGSGTTLALEDAMVLSEELHKREDLETGLEAYEEQRRTALLPLQSEADRSAQWFENAQHYIDQGAARFVYSLRKRCQLDRSPGETSWNYRLHLAAHLATQKITPLRRLRRWI